MRLEGVRLMAALALLCGGVAWLAYAGESSAVADVQLTCAHPPDNASDVVLCDDFEKGPPSDVLYCAERFGFGDACAVRAPTRLTFPGLREAYVRWYQYIPTQEDGAQPNDSVTLSDAADTMVVSMVGLNRQPQGLGSLFLDSTKWYLFEWHVKLNTPGQPDGISELWIDDTTLPIQSQTLRMRRTDMQWLGADDDEKQLEVVRLTSAICESMPDACRGPIPENSVGPLRWDRVVVARMPVGPVPLGPPPPPPGGLKIIPN